HHKSSNTFDGRSVRGKGDARYIGLGALLHEQWHSGWHAAGSLRVGHGRMDWHSNDLIMGGSHKVRGSYSTSGIYFGAHAGVGYELALNDATALDLTAEYHWAHQDSDTATVAGDRFEFDSMNSHRTRRGLQVNRDFSERTTAYAGLPCEHEVDGKA